MATVKILYGKTADRLENYLKEREQDHQEIGCKVITTEHSCFLNGMASEFKQVQADCGSEGNDALHIIQSWSPEESKQLTAEQVNVMGMEMVQKFSEGHQFIIQTHTDEAHFHNHIIVNPVHMETGKRIQNKRKNLYQLRDINDDIARAHGLSVLPKQPKLKRSGPSEKVRRIEAYRGKSYIIDLGKKAQFARSYATGMDDYCSILSGFNISTRVENKNITYFYPGRNVGKRGRNLSHELDLEGLEKKFLENRTRIQSEPNFRKLVEQVKGSYSPPYKSGVPPSKESRPSKEDELRIIPPDALKHAKQQSILKYCSESKIELSQTKDGRKVIAGREHLEVSDYLWINHKNKTRGNVIDFVSTHRNCSLMDAISHLTGNEPLSKLSQFSSREESTYRPFSFPKSTRDHATFQKLSSLIREVTHAKSGSHNTQISSWIKKGILRFSEEGGIQFHVKNGNHSDVFEYNMDPSGSVVFKALNSKSHSSLVTSEFQPPQCNSTKKKFRRMVLVKDPWVLLTRLSQTKHQSKNAFILCSSDLSKHRETLGQYKHIYYFSDQAAFEDRTYSALKRELSDSNLAHVSVSHHSYLQMHQPRQAHHRDLQPSL